MLENLAILDKNLSSKIIIESEIKKLQEQDLLKQFKIISKGLKLAKTTYKDSKLEGNFNFVVIRFSDIVLIANEDKENNRSSSKPISEIDFPSIESFMKKYKESIALSQIFEELTPNSEIKYLEQDLNLWIMISDKSDYLLQDKSWISPLKIDRP